MRDLSGPHLASNTLAAVAKNGGGFRSADRTRCIRTKRTIWAPGGIRPAMAGNPRMNHRNQLIYWRNWSEREDLNLRPLVPQTSALTGLRYAPNRAKRLRCCSLVQAVAQEGQACECPSGLRPNSAVQAARVARREDFPHARKLRKKAPRREPFYSTANNQCMWLRWP